MKRVALFALLTLALLATLGALTLSLSCKKAEGTDLATRFPAQTQLFAQVVHLGQWMELPPGAETASQPQSRGRDPLLQVLGQVWAAEALKPEELPVLLKDQPFAVGIWTKGEAWEGVALLPLGPGHRSALEPLLAEKLGGEKAGEAGGLSFRDSAKVMDGERRLLWAVGDGEAVLATSLEAAGAVLKAGPKTLADTSAFQRATKGMPADRGASLFVSTELMRQMAEKGGDSMFSHFTGAPSQAPPEPPAPPAPPVPPATTAPEAPPAPDAPPAAAEPGMDALLAPVADAAKKFFDPESLAAFAAWTSPPTTQEQQWEAKACLAYGETPKGFWKMASELDTVRPSLAGRVPRDGDRYLWVGGFNAAQHYRCLMDEAAKILPQGQMSTLRGGIGFLEGKLGLSLANDLLPTLGDEALTVQAGSRETQRWVMALSLKDARRFESLVAEKVATSLPLESLTFPGARGWKMSGVTLLVSGGVALFTNNPEWALSSGKEPGKAWKRLEGSSGATSGILSLASEGAGGFPAFASWRLSPEGMLFEAQVPGKPLKLPIPKLGKPQESKKEAI